MKNDMFFHREKYKMSTKFNWLRVNVFDVYPFSWIRKGLMVDIKK